jgi:hypothetical protein
MIQTVFKKLAFILGVVFCMSVVWGSAFGQGGNETEAATESHLLQVMLPSNAQRVMPQSVPAEITQTLDKVVAAGNGKFQKGETEVLLWAGNGYKKSNASSIVNRLTGSMKTAGWQYSVQGEENGVTVFMAIKDSPRRAIVGFYGATDEALIWATMEVLPNNGATSTQNVSNDAADSQSSAVADVAPTKTTKKSGTGGGSLAGKWSNGYSSIWSGYVPTVGPKIFTPGKGHFWEYTFHPDGTFEYVGLLQSTMYNCTLLIFQDKRGSYTINGDQITLTKTKNFFRQSNSCAPSSNKERSYNLEPEVYSVRTTGDQVCLTSSDGGTEVCYSRAKE